MTVLSATIQAGQSLSENIDVTGQLDFIGFPPEWTPAISRFRCRQTAV